MNDIRSIIKDSGGAHAIADASQLSAKPISFEAVKKWPRIGIPDEHWPLVMSLSGRTVEQIYSANAALRPPYPLPPQGGNGQDRAA